MSKAPLLGTRHSSSSKNSAFFFSFVALIGLIGILEVISFKQTGQGILLGKIQYYYLPATAIRYDPVSKHEVLAGQFADLTPVDLNLNCHQETLDDSN
mmetsp:Transcript_76467/g.205938  ORF Transcript_76467/g.205938 Transcript_76467/m.205938 type:complete len:98 (+) Transcript_76467:46-339(+)